MFLGLHPLHPQPLKKERQEYFNYLKICCKGHTVSNDPINSTLGSLNPRPLRQTRAARALIRGMGASIMGTGGVITGITGIMGGGVR